jgi:cysteine desulfurase/selenocysteine lyase
MSLQLAVGHPASPPCGPRALDVLALRDDFPILRQKVHGRTLVYLDNAASAQKPQCVIDAERRVYEEYYANIHRGVHDLSQRATDAYEAARDKVQRFLNARRREEIIFVRGATEGINLVAATYGRANVGKGDEVLISGLEHHSNIVPWQMLCEEKRARLRVARSARSIASWRTAAPKACPC